MKTHKKKSKVESSSEEESDSSSSSSSSSSNDSHRKKSTVNRKKAKVSHTRSKEDRKPESSGTVTKDVDRETLRKTYREDSHKYKNVQNEKNSYNSSRDAKDRDRKEKHTDHEQQKPRYGNDNPRHENEKPRYENEKLRYENERSKYDNEKPRYENEKQRYENDRPRYENEKSRYENEKQRHENFADRRDFRNDRETGDGDKYRRHRHNEQYNNYNRNNYQQDTSRDRYRRSDEQHRNQRFRDRGSFKEDHDDDQRTGNKYGRNKRDRSRSRSYDHQNAKWGKDGDDNNKKEKGKPGNKEKPNFGLSGKLTEERNTYRGVVIKYSEPPEARKPKRRWRLYPFKGEKALQTLYIHRESAYLIGRERKVVDLPVDHPSCSKQHAALQYRLVPFTREDGSTGKRVRPYLIDLDSANGTYINNKKVDPKKYIELLERDVIKFGFSSREYVLLHENSKDEAQDDDVKLEDEEEVPVKKEEVKVEI